MTAEPVRAPRRILVPVDLSDRSATAVAYGAMLARLAGAELMLTINVNMPERAAIEESMAEPGTAIEEAAHAALAALADRTAPDVTATTDVRFRDFPAEGILAAADDHDVDLIAIGSHGRTGLSRVLLGSVAERIARQASIPVVIVRVAAS
ncbi:MAG: universal stress protein [Actinomycetota bacterium]